MDKKRVYSGEAGKEKNAGQKQKKASARLIGKCGGCQYVDMPYKAQLKRKQKQAEMLLKEYGKVKPIIGMEEPAHYRNKVHAVFAFQKGRGIVSGIYQEKSHRVVPVENCLLEDQKAGEIIRSVRELAKSFKLKAYDEDSGLRPAPPCACARGAYHRGNYGGSGAGIPDFAVQKEFCK